MMNSNSERILQTIEERNFQTSLIGFHPNHPQTPSSFVKKIKIYFLIENLYDLHEKMMRPIDSTP